MTFKRQIDRLPIIPADAKEHNVTCQFCIVGCGYKAYTWDINDQGGTAPNANKFGVDLSKQQDAMTANWYAPSMYNIVKQDGKDVHLVIKPDVDCVVNSGLGSIRGARMAEESYSEARSTQQQRLTEPMVWRYGQMQPTSWDDALDLVARVTAAVIDEQGEDGLFVSAFDHGGAGGGYENTWGTGKLYFGAMKIKNIRIHNRPAYNSEVHATRDMGVGELNNCYEDAELADTIVAVGTNSLETQTNYFLNHWVPNLRGTTLDKKKTLMPDEPHAAARIIFVDPRRTVTVNACEVEAGKDNVLHLADQFRHRLGAVQCLLHLHRRQGLGAEGLHREEHVALGAVAPAALPGARRLAGDAGPSHQLRSGPRRMPDFDRRRGQDHRLEPSRHRQGGRMDRHAERGRRAPPGDDRLREGHHLGQRQLPHQRRDRERRAGHRQHRSTGRRRRSPWRPSGRLCRVRIIPARGRRLMSTSF